MARTKTLLVRLSVEEMEEVASQAARARKSVSDWVRGQLLPPPEGSGVRKKPRPKPLLPGRAPVRPAVLPMTVKVGTRDAGLAAVLAELRESGIPQEDEGVCVRCQRMGLSECSTLCKSQRGKK